MSDLLTVRYPSGETEFRTSDRAPQVGDVLSRNGDTWIVDAVSESESRTLVTLRPGPEAGDIHEPE